MTYPELLIEKKSINRGKTNNRSIDWPGLRLIDYLPINRLINRLIITKFEEIKVSNFDTFSKLKPIFLLIYGF